MGPDRIVLENTPTNEYGFYYDGTLLDGTNLDIIAVKRAGYCRAFEGDGYAVADGFLDDERNVKCKKGYEKHKNVDRIRCLRSRKWVNSLVGESVLRKNWCTKTVNYCHWRFRKPGEDEALPTGKIGDKRKIRCVSGFGDKINAYECVEDGYSRGKWRSETSCVKQANYCQSKSPAEGYAEGLPEGELGERKKISCPFGREGKAEYQCMNDGLLGKWLPNKGNCPKKGDYCPKSELIADGEKDALPAAEIGKEIAISCAFGYEGPAKYQCRAKNGEVGKWESKDRCAKKKAYCLPVLANANKGEEQGLPFGEIGETTEVSCAFGYEGTTEYKCTEDGLSNGRWEAVEGQCYIKAKQNYCKLDYKQVKNGNIIAKEIFASLNEVVTKQRIQRLCLEGHVYKGGSIECLPHDNNVGRWNVIPECEKSVHYRPSIANATITHEESGIDITNMDLQKIQIGDTFSIIPNAGEYYNLESEFSGLRLCLFWLEAQSPSVQSVQHETKS